MAGVGWRGGEKMQTTVIEQQLKKRKKRIYLFSRFDFGSKQIFMLKRNNTPKMESLVVNPTKA